MKNLILKKMRIKLEGAVVWAKLLKIIVWGWGKRRGKFVPVHTATS